jgi:NADH-quinone oxidoreductase subunit L
MDDDTRSHLHETSPVVWVPLVLLAIPSAIIGWFTIEVVLFGGYFDNAIVILKQHGAMAAVAEVFHGPANFVVHGFSGPVLYLAAAGVVSSWYIYLRKPSIADATRRRFSFIYNLLDQKYYCDRFNQAVFAGTCRGIGHLLWRLGDALVIDGFFVNGSARLVGWLSGVIRQVQTGYLNHYAFAMISGLILLLGWAVLV